LRKPFEVRFRDKKRKKRDDFNFVPLGVHDPAY
jgi:hypothetical protein